MNRYESYGEQEFLLLVIYCLFDVRESDVRKARAVMEDITGRSCSDFRLYVKPLVHDKLLRASNYNWRTCTFDYSIMPEEMVPLMLFLVEQRKNLTLRVLDAAAKRLKPSYIQRLLWHYIINDFNEKSVEIIDYQVKESLDYLLPVVEDSRFAPLLLELDVDGFFDLLCMALEKYFRDERLVDTNYVTSIINQYEERGGNASLTLRLRCLLDLYAYMAYGRMPEQLLSNNKNHRIIAALYEAYHGSIIKALEHFKKAVALNNKARSEFAFVTSSKSYLVLSSSNFFYVLVAFLSDTEEGRKKCQAVTKGKEHEFIRTAKVLYNIIKGAYTDNDVNSALNALLTSSEREERTAGILLCHYTGKAKLIRDAKLTDKDAPRWLIYKHEMRKYAPMKTEEEETANRCYSEKGLLSGIHYRQEWENVLDDLIGLTSSGQTKQGRDEKALRIGYFIDNMNSMWVRVRQQSILKNGSWGAGKHVSMNSFLAGEIEGMTDDDREISMTSLRNHSYSFGLDICSVLPKMTENSRLYVGLFAPYALVDVVEEMPYLTLVHDDNGFRIMSNVPSDEVEQDVIITHRGPASINFIHMTEAQRPYYRRLLSLEYFPDEAEPQLREFLKNLGGKVEVNSDLIDGGSTLPVVKGSSQLVMQMRPQTRDTYIVGLFVRPLKDGHIRCVPGEGNETIIDSGTWTTDEGAVMNGRTRVERDVKAEEENIEHFQQHCKQMHVIDDGIGENSMVVVDAYELLPLIEYAQDNPDRISCEWPEGARMRIKHRQQSVAWSGAIKKTDNGWFEIEGSIEIDQGKVVTMAQLLDLASQSRGRFIKLDDGEFLALSEKLRKQLSQLGAIRRAAVERGRRGESYSQAYQGGKPL